MPQCSTGTGKQYYFKYKTFFLISSAANERDFFFVKEEAQANLTLAYFHILVKLSFTFADL